MTGIDSLRFGFVRWGAAALAAALVTLAPPGGARAAAAQEPAGQPRGVVVDSVEVAGASRIPPEQVRTFLNLSRGDTVTYRDVQRAIQRLYGTGHFRDIKFFLRGESATECSPCTVVVEVEEYPFIADIEWRGLEHVSPGSVVDTIGLKPGVPLQPAKVAEVKARARELLSDRGFQVRRIEDRIEEIEGRPGQYRLVIEVDEGGRVAIAEVDFEGNEVLSDDDLRGAMQTKPEGFLWFRSGTYDEEKLRADVRENIPAHYAGRGYIDAVVTGDTLVVDPETGKARLQIRVSEGAQYRIAEFDVRGNSRFSTDELKRYFEQDRGGLLQGLGIGGPANGGGRPVFDQEAFTRATERVRQLYNNQGYLYAQIEPVIERDTADGQNVVRVAWQVAEGQPAYVNRVTIAGNTFTHERVIREQVLLLPGDVYSEDLLIQSYRNVMALGFFESPLPTPRIEPNDKGDVNITFEVKEKQTGSVNFGTAIGGGTGLAGFLGYDQPNLFGQAKSGHLRWEFGRYTNNFEASYSDPSILGSLISGSLSLFSSKNSYGRLFRFSEGEQRRTGASVRFGLPLPGDRSGRTRVFLGYSLARTAYEQFDEDAGSLFALPPGFQSTFTVNLVRNTLDSPLFPTVGTRQEFSADFTGGPLGGDARFQKYTLTGAWYVPVGQLGGGSPGGRPVRFTLGLTAEAGVLAGDASRFPFERFWMGGVQFGRPLRGYEETTVTPFGFIPRGASDISLENRLGDAFLRLSAEYGLRLNDNLSLSLFYDAGNVWRRPGEIDPTRLLRGAGLGATLVTPFGPLGLDYAYGFDKDRPGWQLHFKFGPGF